MKAHTISNAIGLVLLLSLNGCYYDKEDILYPEASCENVVNPTFSGDILPLINVRCNSCHSGPSASAGIKLESYADIVKQVNSGALMGSIQHASGYSAMPKNGSKLSGCEIQKIQAWIDSGLNNN